MRAGRQGVASETISTRQMIIESPDVTVATETRLSHVHPTVLRCVATETPSSPVSTTVNT